MKKIEFNCDVGEGLGNESKLMPFIQSCNIACGGHAGNNEIMSQVVTLAIHHKVKIGAHPSYPDRKNFGRKTMLIPREKLIETIQNQVNNLIVIIKKQKGSLHHIKPHGALYNDIAKNNELSLHFLEAVEPYKKEIKLMVPYHSIIAYNAINQGFSIIYEAFADRNYNEDYSLVERQNPEALLTNPEKILKHVRQMFDNEIVTTLSGLQIPMKANTFCVHSDTENAVEILKYLRQFS